MTDELMLLVMKFLSAGWKQSSEAFSGIKITEVCCFNITFAC